MGSSRLTRHVYRVPIGCPEPSRCDPQCGSFVDRLATWQYRSKVGLHQELPYQQVTSVPSDRKHPVELAEPLGAPFAATDPSVVVVQDTLTPTGWKAPPFAVEAEQSSAWLVTGINPISPATTTRHRSKGNLLSMGPPRWCPQVLDAHLGV